jgi:hypothetical protein
MAKSIYPSIPMPGLTLNTLAPAVEALRQTVNLIILNGLSPNPGYTPSETAQVFVTYAALTKIGVVGPRGPQGPPGAPGTPGIGEAPNDVNTYGRHNLNWTQVLTALNPVLSALPVNAASDTAAAIAGVPVNGIYRNGSVLMVRVT